MDFNYALDNYSKKVQQAFPVMSIKHEPFLTEKANQLIDLAQRHLGETKKLRLLDVGCGTGLMEGILNNKFNSIVGVDISADAIEKAKQSGLNAQFISYDGGKLPFNDDEFDVVFACCVFHHIPNNQRLSVAKEMFRVAAPGGLVILFEHNPWNPITRLIVSRCEFDRDVELLHHRESVTLLRDVGLSEITSTQILYFPWRGSFWKLIERFISWIPLGAQYVVSGNKPMSI